MIEIVEEMKLWPSRIYRGMQDEVGVVAAWLLPGLSFLGEDRAGALSLFLQDRTPLYPPYLAACH